MFSRPDDSPARHLTIPQPGNDRPFAYYAREAGAAANRHTPSTAIGMCVEVVASPDWQQASEPTNGPTRAAPTLLATAGRKHLRPRHPGPTTAPGA